eukprot:4214526-Pleurochrysis_carterae.AAC.1
MDNCQRRRGRSGEKEKGEEKGEGKHEERKTCTENAALQRVSGGGTKHHSRGTGDTTDEKKVQ